MPNETVTVYLHSAQTRCVAKEEILRRIFRTSGWREQVISGEVTSTRLMRRIDFEKGSRKITVASYFDRVLHVVQIAIALEVPHGWVRVVYDAIDNEWVRVRDCPDDEVPVSLAPWFLPFRIVDDLSHADAFRILEKMALCADSTSHEGAGDSAQS